MDLSAAKSSLWDIIDKRKNEIVGLCSDLIRIPSENPPGNVDEIVSFISQFLAKNGIESRITGPAPEYPNIIAGIGKGPVLLFNGHCDVVPAGDRARWNFDPFGGEITSTTIRGRGTSDMKCGLGAALFAMSLFAQGKIPLGGRLEIHIVPDEETGGANGTKWLVENGYADNAFACIVAEPTSSDTCEVGQKGQIRIHVTAQGKAAHGSIGNYVGENAIMKVATLLSRIEELRSMEGVYSESQTQVLFDSKKIAQEKLERPHVEDVIDHVTVNPGIIKGGIKINMVPDLCEADIDVRIPIGLPAKKVIAQFEEIIQQLNLNNIQYRVEYSEANFTEVSEPLVHTIVNNAEAIWHHKVIPAYQWASSDARYYRNKGIPTLQYGPANTEGIHSYNEDVDIEDVINATKIYSATICDLLVRR
jgi:succinyl-diaminopimelate desuccinylase